MPNLLDSLNPITGIISAVSGIIDKFVPNAEDKAKAALALTQLQTDATLKMAELEEQRATTQASVVNTEAKSESWLTRNWRPIVMLFFCTLLGTVVFTGGYVNGHLLDKDFVLEILSTIKLGLSGYVAGRTIEKVAPGIVSAFTNKAGGAT